jgi:hypothetical protein
VSVTAAGPPPLRPFGLVLHHDGRFSHEGVPILHPRLRAAFDRSVRWLPDESCFVVQIGRFRGQIEVEEAAFFVRDYDAASGALRLSDASRELLDPATLRLSPRDGALLCAVKRDLAPPAGLLARFLHAAQAELLAAVEGPEQAPRLRLGGQSLPLPPRLLADFDGPEAPRANPPN